MKSSTSSFEAPSDQSTSELMDTTYQSKSTTRTTIKTSDKSTTKVTSASVVSTELQSTAKTGCIIVPHPQKPQINPNRAGGLISPHFFRWLFLHEKKGLWRS